MDTHHELTKKATILFSPLFYKHLKQVAKHNKVSVGHLVRQACEQQYGIINSSIRKDALEKLKSFSLPVDDVKTIKKQSVLDPDSLLPINCHE